MAAGTSSACISKAPLAETANDHIGDSTTAGSRATVGHLEKVLETLEDAVDVELSRICASDKEIKVACELLRITLQDSYCSVYISDF